MIYKADLHNHFSHKSEVLDPNKVADRVYGALGPNSICALVNYSDRRFEAFAEQAEQASPNSTRIGNAVYFPDRKVLIVKGEEVPTLEGDVLAIGIKENEHLEPHKPLLETLKRAKELGGINIITTPCFMSRIGNLMERAPLSFRRELSEHISAIEIHNANAPLWANMRNRRLENLLDWNLGQVGKISCSDGYSFREVGRSYTILHSIEPLNLDSPEELNKELNELIKSSPKELICKYSPWGTFEHCVFEIARRISQIFDVPFSYGKVDARIEGTTQR